MATILTASAQDVQADQVLRDMFLGAYNGDGNDYTEDDRDFALSVSPLGTGTEHIGFFV